MDTGVVEVRQFLLHSCVSETLTLIRIFTFSSLLMSVDMIIIIIIITGNQGKER